MASGALKREAGGCTYAYAQVWLESLGILGWKVPSPHFLSLSLFILDHAHKVESYAGKVDSDMPPTQRGEQLVVAGKWRASSAISMTPTVALSITHSARHEVE